MQQPSTPHLFTTKVYLEDVDAGGIVYHANHLKYAERARTELLAAGGVSHAEMLKIGGGIVVAALTIRYLRPLRLEETLVVSTRIANIAAASADLEQQISVEGDCAAVLNVGLVCLGPAGKPVRWPAAVRKALARAEGQKT